MVSTRFRSHTDDLVVLIALAAITGKLAALAHEGVGHGVACLSLEGRVVRLWALDLQCDLRTGSVLTLATRTRVVAAAGPLVPLMLGFAVFAWLRSQRRSALRSLPFLSAWFAAAFLILPNLGYFCLAPWPIGDWAIVLGGSSPRWIAAPLALIGALGYWFMTRALFRELAHALGADSVKRVARGRRIAWTGYAVANVLTLVAALLQTHAASSMALSGPRAALASLLATSGLVWGVLALRRDVSPSTQILPYAPFRWGVALCGLVCSLLFMAVLGPGVNIMAFVPWRQH